MYTTIAMIALFLSLLLWGLLAGAFFLKIAARWAKIPGIGYGFALLTFLLTFLPTIAITVLAPLIPNLDALSPLTLALAELALDLFLTSALIAAMFKTTLARAFLAWLPTLIPGAVALLLMLFVIRPYICEGFLIPSNSMAPTMIGFRSEIPCPQCGAPAIVSWFDDQPPTPRRPQTSICTKARHVFQADRPGPRKLPGDRILVNKLIRPQRWDAIAFRFPEQPSVIHLQRIVGLPNEQVIIRDGSVWINGQRQAPPPSCGRLNYGTELPPGSAVKWGTEKRPAQLGPDEYFVLGDFSEMALDSRMWTRGAQGHHPYAVPASHINGVATHIYWPISRWRIFR